MYNSYNYNIPQYRQNMYQRRNNNDQRLIGGGFVAPFLLGGVAGFAIGNNRPNYGWGPRPRPFYYPYPTYYSNNYYYNPYYY